MDNVASATVSTECIPYYLPFFGGVLMDGVKNFVTVLTLLDFSLVFLSSNLLKGVIAGWGCPLCCLLV